MQEQTRYAVGIDVGTTNVRCVVGHIDASTGIPAVVGVGQASNSGMRKGVVVNLGGPAKAIDEALGEAERMSGYEINEATLSINGSHILSTKADGMVAVSSGDHQVEHSDVLRVEEVATIGKVPPNREIIEVVPYSYRLDGQDGIKDPVGMTGTRLEINANVISALTPHVNNLTKASEMATVMSHDAVPSVLAAGRAVLTETQLESGVAIIDMGGATTGVAVYEEGDLQHLGVIPMGGINVTNDLAIGLKVDPDVAEKVKIKHGSATPRSDNTGVSHKLDSEILSFQTDEIDEIIDARLEEIFELIQKELKKAGRAGQLPSGVVLTGGAAQMKSMAECAREKLGLSARLGQPRGFSGVNEKVESPAFATAVGLMLSDTSGASPAPGKQRPHTGQSNTKTAGMEIVNQLQSTVKNLFSKFKS